MKERGLLSYVWHEHFRPFFLVIPLFRFVLLASIFNRRLDRVPEKSIRIVKLSLQVVFGIAFAVLFLLSLLSFMDYFGFIRFGLLRQVSWRPIPELLVLWVAGGMYSFFTFVTYGNWQFRRPST